MYELKAQRGVPQVAAAHQSCPPAAYGPFRPKGSFLLPPEGLARLTKRERARRPLQLSTASRNIETLSSCLGL